MATRIAWWLNFDGPSELEHPGRFTPSRAMRERALSLVARMQTLLVPGDVVLDGSRGAADLPGFIALAFCNSPSALLGLEKLGFTPPSAPPLPVLRALTRRCFAASLGQTLQGAVYVESLSALEAVLRGPCTSDEWLIKRDFSFAGRERRRVRGSRLDASTLGFVKRSFALGQGLQVEPYMRRDADFALHGYVTDRGAILLGNPLSQDCDARGVWQESRSLEPGALRELEERALCLSAQQAGEALCAHGYRGPFGVDAFRYAGENGQLAFQPRSEVNVRFSMGYPRELLERALAANQQDTRKV